MLRESWGETNRAAGLHVGVPGDLRDGEEDAGLLLAQEPAAPCPARTCKSRPRRAQPVQEPLVTRLPSLTSPSQARPRVGRAATRAGRSARSRASSHRVLHRPHTCAAPTRTPALLLTRRARAASSRARVVSFAWINRARKSPIRLGEIRKRVYFSLFTSPINFFYFL
jgi:hypothetical protein